jgi:hypothetical protein
LAVANNVPTEVLSIHFPQAIDSNGLSQSSHHDSCYRPFSWNGTVTSLGVWPHHHGSRLALPGTFMVRLDRIPPVSIKVIEQWLVEAIDQH